MAGTQVKKVHRLIILHNTIDLWSGKRKSKKYQIMFTNLH